MGDLSYVWFVFHETTTQTNSSTLFFTLYLSVTHSFFSLAAAVNKGEGREGGEFELGGLEGVSFAKVSYIYLYFLVFLPTSSW